MWAVLVSLYKVENGEAVKLGFSGPEKMATSVLIYHWKKKAILFYRQKADHKGGDLKNVIYLKPGDNKSVEFISSKLGIDYDSCKINNQTRKLFSCSNGLIFLSRCKAGTNRAKRDDISLQYNEFVTKAEEFKKTVNTSNNRISTSYLKLKVDTDLELCKSSSLLSFRRKNERRL